MSIWAIADIHGSATDPVSGRPLKPMDVFGEQWINHMERLERAWRESVTENDTVLIAGDIDWGLRLDDARETLNRINSFPGHKILIRGNHDYWWSSKATSKVRRILPITIQLIQNDAIQVGGFNVCGAKGSPVPGGIDWTPQNDKLLNRERERLQASLERRNADFPTVVMLHYPPFYPALGNSPFSALLEEYGVSACVYGHLHGDAAASGPRGQHGSVHYSLVAGDNLAFRPVCIVHNESLAVGSTGPLQATRLPTGEPGMTEDSRPNTLRGLAHDVDEVRIDEVRGQGTTLELLDVAAESAQDTAKELNDGRQRAR